LEAHRSIEGTWEVFFSSPDELVKHISEGVKVCAYMDNVGSVINARQILQLHTLSAGSPLLEGLLRVRGAISVFINPWTLFEFDKIMKKLGIEGSSVLQRRFPPNRNEWCNLFRELFGINRELTLYEVVGLNLRILLQRYDEMNEELSMMVKNINLTDFRKKWEDIGNAIFLDEILFRVSGNNHLIYHKPTDNYKSYVPMFGSPLLLRLFSKMVRGLKIMDMFNLYQQAIINSNFPKTGVGILYESLLNKILSGESGVHAEIDFNDIVDRELCEAIYFGTDCGEGLELTNFYKSLSFNKFYYQVGGEQWKLIDYMKFVFLKSVRTLIGVQATVGKTHSVSNEGIQTIKTLKDAHKMKNYIQIYFVPDINYFQIPVNIYTLTSEVYVCQVELKRGECGMKVKSNNHQKINYHAGSSSSSFPCSPPILSTPSRGHNSPFFTPITQKLFEGMLKKILMMIHF
jgi:hypothetical protein